MEFTLRDYSPSDFETLYEIDQACYPRGIAYSRRMLRWYLGQRGAFCIVAETTGEPEPTVIGFLVADHLDPGQRRLVLCQRPQISEHQRRESVAVQMPGEMSYIARCGALSRNSRS